MSEQRFNPAVLPGVEKRSHNDDFIRKVPSDDLGGSWVFEDVGMSDDHVWRMWKAAAHWTLPPDITQADAEIVLMHLGFPNLPRRFDGERWGFARGLYVPERLDRDAVDEDGRSVYVEVREDVEEFRVSIYYPPGRSPNHLTIPASSNDTAAIIKALREHGVEIEEVGA